jgi:hypothetical protein
VVLIHAKPCLALWYLLGWLVDQGGVANLKTVPIYQGVTDVFLRSSCTDPDGLQLLGDPSRYCVIALYVTTGD